MRVLSWPTLGHTFSSQPPRPHSMRCRRITGPYHIRPSIGLLGAITNKTRLVHIAPGSPRRRLSKRTRT